MKCRLHGGEEKHGHGKPDLPRQQDRARESAEGPAVLTKAPLALREGAAPTPQSSLTLHGGRKAGQELEIGADVGTNAGGVILAPTLLCPQGAARLQENTKTQ